MKKVKLWLVFKKIFRSKAIVVLALVLAWCVGSKMQVVKADYSASVAYQYYLLGEKSDDIVDSTKDQKIALKMGSIGSGGISGEFSYDEIVNSASEKNVPEAKKFASIMATYSTFNYFSNKVEGFGAIIPFLGRVLSGIVLLPLAVATDVLSALFVPLIQVVAKLNIIPLLAELLTNLSIKSKLTEALGIDPAVFKKFVEILFTFSVVMIIFTLGRMFKMGGKVDQRAFSKLKGRLFSIVAVPIIVGIGATIINDIMTITMSGASTTNAFSRYLIDDRSWAYNYNFAPNGNDASEGNIAPNNNGSYVDLSFNPYTEKGKARIEKINADSSLANQSGGAFNFGNSALVLSYISSQSFSAVDYINYKGTVASKTLYGQDDKANSDTFGSYYEHAKKAEKNLADVSKSFYPSGGERATDKGAVNGGYKSAISDYVTKDKKLNVSPSIAWRDRFIYGAKSSGESIDKYYKEAPSLEQMENEVGNNGGSAFSDQSMFLILSTMFNETGGKYAITAPSRGVMSKIPSFDSNRSNYFVVSMVGSPYFTIFGIISKPLIQVVAMLAVIGAVMTFGLIDMNLRPLSAWIKGSTLGDIEYSYAMLVYSVGIAGTILSMFVIPSLFTTAIEYIPTIMNVTLETAGLTMHTPQSSIAYYGVNLIFQSIIAISIAFLFVKSPTFRDKLISLFTFCWAWAKVTGDRLERQTGGNGSAIVREQKNMSDRFNKRFNDEVRKSRGGEDYNSPLGRFKDGYNDTVDGIKQDLGRGGRQNNKTTANSPDVYNNHNSEPLLSVQDIARNGMFARADDDLRQLEDSEYQSVRFGAMDTQEELTKLKQNPTADGYQSALEKFESLKNNMMIENVGDADFKKFNTAQEELHNIGNSLGFNGGGNSGGNIFTTNHYNSQHSEYYKYETKEVQALADTLGSVSENRDIARALDKINNAHDNAGVQKGLSKLQESISHLDLKDREQIDNSQLSKSLDRIMDLKK